MEIDLRKQMLLMVRALYFTLEERWALLTRNYNISTAQQHVLYILFTNETALTVTQISKMGCWHISTVTRLLKPLIQERYIVVCPDPFSSKTKCVEITEGGKALVQAILTDLVNAADFPYDLSDVSEEQMKGFLRLGLHILQKQKGESFVNWVHQAEVIVNS